MKRHAFQLTIAVLTFSLGASAAWMFIQRPRPQGKEFTPQTRSTAVPTPPMSVQVIKLAAAPYPIGEDDAVSLQFVTDNDGWLSINGRLWRTGDGGKNWERVRIPNPKTNKNESVIKVQFLNSQLGWVAADSGLFRTDDGGRTWTLQKRSTEVGTDKMNLIASVAFAKDGRHGWIIENRYRPLLPDESPGGPHSSYSSDGNHILSSFIKFTEDGGVSWTTQAIDPTWNSLERITAIDSSHAIAYGIAGVYVLQGDEWVRAMSEYERLSTGSYAQSLEAACGSGCSIPTTIGFVDGREGWVANSNGYVGRSLDGGNTWADVSNGLWRGLEAHQYDVQVQFLNRHNGWGLAGDGRLVTSQNEGVSWQNISDSRTFTRFYFLDESHGWAVSKDGVFLIMVVRLQN